MPDRIWLSTTFTKIRRDSFLMHYGDTLDHIFIICKGVVEVSSSNPNDHVTKVVFVKEGNMIGEMEALIGENIIAYNARAYTDCDLIRIPSKTFLKWFETDIYIVRKLSLALAKKLYESSMEAIKYSQHPAIIRLAGLLHSEDEGVVVKTRQQLAETCGVSVRTINRCIIKLKEKELISLYKGKIVISKEQKEVIERMYYKFLSHNINDF
ncbi:MAG: Crp/Fnr family transcriptional regulator [Clostridiales bacterium]|nr:Crp/Fnr family transcriptional regulator [Clostridiales bacterium]